MNALLRSCTCDLPSWGFYRPETHHALLAEFDHEARLVSVSLVQRGRTRRLRASEDFKERVEASRFYATYWVCPLSRAKALPCGVMGMAKEHAA